MSVVVKRFRTLGQIQRRVIPESSIVDSSSVSPLNSVAVSDTKVRTVRNDKKHQYPLRMLKPFWRRIKDLNLQCQGRDSGPSLNATLLDLLEAALGNDAIISLMLQKYPDREQLVIIRSWERE